MSVPGFLLSFAELMGIPSGLHVAYMSALAVQGENILAPLCGCAAAVLMRILWGASPALEMLLSLAVMMVAPIVLHQRGNAAMVGWTGLALLPVVVVKLVVGSAAEILLAVGCVLVSVLAAPVLLRGIQVLRSGRAVRGMEERIAVGFLVGTMVTGGGRMLLAGLNVGVLFAALITCAMAMTLGVSAGTVTGMIIGLTLSLQGLPVQLSVALAVGGFLAGMLRPVGKRWLTCLAFAAGCSLLVLLSGADGLGAMGASWAAPLILALLPGPAAEPIQRFFRRFLTVHTAAGDAYASAALNRWEQTMSAMAEAVPTPCAVDGPRDTAWWRAHLCAECPEYATCRAMDSDFAVKRAEEAWTMRHDADEAWPEALEHLRGLGCARLYCLREAMTRLRAEEPAARQAYRRACYQRDMLVTHLSAMAGAAKHFAQMSGGESWWDELGARAIRKALDDHAFPAALMYMRRVDGHACAAFEMNQSILARRLNEQLCSLAGSALGLEMEVERIEGDRVYLTERPQVSVGFACASAPAEGASGDHLWLGRISGGRFMAALSDGMGQGARAGQESAATVELLRLCMEAGYTRSQTITAVNGMMLLETGGERFATVDLLSIDLWSGQAVLDKLGAVSSWLLRGDSLVELTGDALPIGILESVSSRTSMMRLRDGDRLIMMTDGVEDAFEDRKALERAVRSALEDGDDQAAAEGLMDRARHAGEGEQADDQTVAVISVRMEK